MASSSSPTPLAPPGVWRRLSRDRTCLASLAILFVIVFLAVLGLVLQGQSGPATFLRDHLPVSLSQDPHLTHDGKTDQFAPPSSQHLFGTDLNGRDLFARVLEGARISLVVGVCGALVSFFIGTAYGMVAGYVGGGVDSAMMRLVEVLYSVPRLIIIIIASFTFDPKLREWMIAIGQGALIGYSKVIILILALGVIEWLTMARIVRGQVLTLKSQQFVTAARSLGQSHFKIIVRHLFPNLIGIVIVYLTLTIPAVILDESFLSFLGLGINDPQASWGKLLTDGAQSINPIKIYWWLIFFPALFMSLTLLALNFLGDSLRDALDPRGRKAS